MNIVHVHTVGEGVGSGTREERYPRWDQSQFGEGGSIVVCVGTKRCQTCGAQGCHMTVLVCLPSHKSGGSRMFVGV